MCHLRHLRLSWNGRLVTTTHSQHPHLQQQKCLQQYQCHRLQLRLHQLPVCSAEMLLPPMTPSHQLLHLHLHLQQQKCLQQYQCHRLQLRLHQLPVCSAEMLLPPMTPSHQLLHLQQQKCLQRWDPWALQLIVPNPPWQGQGPQQQHRKRQHKLPLQGMDL